MATDAETWKGKFLAELFPEEKTGWRGYIEWEKYPERREIARQILSSKTFPDEPEFQFVPLPNTNPILDGNRWKAYHEALGLKSIVDVSWATVLKEKPDLIHLLAFPYNGETTRPQLLSGKLTDNKYHFIRNHGGVPDIDADAYEVEIGGLVNKPVKISLKDLQDPRKFPQAEVTVTIQCSGTRRIEQIQEYPGDGDELINAPWGEGAIGTAVYRGVPLKKVLKIACGGVLPECQHLEFMAPTPTSSTPPPSPRDRRASTTRSSDSRGGVGGARRCGKAKGRGDVRRKLLRDRG
ncbi:hypothetical protein EWM64_g6484 [Hericium alpestre]|uniref:Oxidoreductase molybdopterin-binding domain-containing protein n=1 Tax=Hericium alpestre TaxID=135208 RepID=A0A4Y9ZRM5_9AGAM|nr:hypothetical protein EWM64_g6484 [Hericium alpestre]